MLSRAGELVHSDSALRIQVCENVTERRDETRREEEQAVGDCWVVPIGNDRLCNTGTHSVSSLEENYQVYSVCSFGRFLSYSLRYLY